MNTESSRMRLRLVAWNLLHGGGPARSPEAALALAAMRPDICLLSEYRVARGSMLRGALADIGLTHALIAPHDYGRNCVAIVSRWKLTHETCVSAELERIVPGNRLIAAYVQELDLRLLSVHVPDESNPTGRAACWRAIVGWAGNSQRSRAIVGGDFNTSRRGIDPPRRGQTCDQMLGALASQGFADVWRLTRTSDAQAISWLGPHGRRQRLDAIFVSKSLEKEVQSAFYNASCAHAGVSDHAPLLVELQVNIPLSRTPMSIGEGLFAGDKSSIRNRADSGQAGSTHQ